MENISLSQNQKLYGDRQAAAYLGCSRMTLHLLKKAGRLPFIRVGHRYSYFTSELDATFHHDAKGGDQ